MRDDINPTLGISRRDVVRRGAIVGGGLVWAAPVVRTMSRSALAQDIGTPEPGAVSFVALVVRRDGSRHQLKFDVGSWGWVTPGEVPGCAPPAGWCAPGQGTAPAGVSCPEPSDGGRLEVTVSGDAARVCFLLPPTCTLESGVAVGAGGELSPDAAGGFCAAPDEGSHSGQTVCFTSP